MDNYDWDIECKTVQGLLAGYAWRWGVRPQSGRTDCEIQYVATEQEFRLPLRNPVSGKATWLFDLAGKIDGIVRLEDGRLAVMEHKLLSDSLDSDADLWRRLRIDQQITLYVWAARQLGYEVDCVLYNVTRKPTIKPTAVPVLGNDGLKIVLDADGNRVMTKQDKPRQTADTAKGFALQTRPMTSIEWQAKLLSDVEQRPEFYFARGEIPRLDCDLEQYQYELWDIQRTLREAQRTNRWYRTVSRNSCQLCPYFDLCSGGFDPSVDPVPEGFKMLTNIHPELKEVSFT